ncbi:MAG TPA: hypothetical protein VHG53_03305 [Candidatus Limnocylindria bacterium]|nr:hypothetical protein [Candidatus Limnocylindria bacterium]
MELGAGPLAGVRTDVIKVEAPGKRDPLQGGASLWWRVRGVRFTANSHDTRGTGLANVWAALGVGIDRFAASFAGLGGCPCASGATVNIATEDTAYLLRRARIETGRDEQMLFAAAWPSA